MEAVELKINAVERAPKPFSNEDEVQLLGGMLLSNGIILEVVALLSVAKEKAFYDKRHKLIYSAMIELCDGGVAVDSQALCLHLRKRGKLDAAGGAGYVVTLQQAVATAAYYKRHCFILLEYHFRRVLIDNSLLALKNSFNESEDIFETVSAHSNSVLDIANFRLAKAYSTLGEVAQGAVSLLREQLNNPLKLDYLATHLVDLNMKLDGGFRNSDLIILAARPSMGKTSLALSFAYNLAKRGVGVAFFSLEMSAHQLGLRLLNLEMNAERAEDNRETIQRFMQNELDKTAVQSLLTVCGERLAGLPFFINDGSKLTISELKVAARKLHIEKKIKFLVVDYLQLMQGDKKDNREREISSISQGLKQIAKELDIPVLALSQLNRGFESRQVRYKKVDAEQTPTLSDLRESGSIEQDADIVLFVHRPEVALKQAGASEDKIKKHYAKLVVGKNRNGATGFVSCYCDIKVGIFSNSRGLDDAPQQKAKILGDKVMASGINLGREEDVMF